MLRCWGTILSPGLSPAAELKRFWLWKPLFMDRLARGLPGLFQQWPGEASGKGNCPCPGIRSEHRTAILYQKKSHLSFPLLSVRPVSVFPQFLTHLLLTLQCFAGSLLRALRTRPAMPGVGARLISETGEGSKAGFFFLRFL